jgi:hypothetical protein
MATGGCKPFTLAAPGDATGAQGLGAQMAGTGPSGIDDDSGKRTCLVGGDSWVGKVIPGPGYVAPEVITCGFREKERRVTAVIGAEYEIDPLNPQKKKHRGRRCVVLDFVRDDRGQAYKVVVRFLDNNRRGRVDIDDLKAEGLTEGD